MCECVSRTCSCSAGRTVVVVTKTPWRPRKQAVGAVSSRVPDEGGGDGNGIGSEVEVEVELEVVLVRWCITLPIWLNSCTGKLATGPEIVIVQIFHSRAMLQTPTRLCCPLVTRKQPESEWTSALRSLFAYLDPCSGASSSCACPASRISP
jgi:hypothetical protein